VVVLAIGESSRKRNFSLYGYERRDTNPELQKTGDLHLLNGIARRGTTLYALPEILEKASVKLPMMVAKLGIPTACYVNYTLYDNCASVGETKASNCGHGGKCYDEDVLPLLEKNLASYQSGNRFVVLHLGGGSHGPVYSERHPPEFQQFKPMCNDADVANQCTLEQIYNSYDNTILYVDHVLGQIIQKLDGSGAPYVLIYLSDHGESLMDDGRMFHGMPPGVSLPPEQAEIPLIVKSSVPISIVPRAEYHQQDVFDTVLDLFSIQTPMFDTKGSFIKRSAGPLDTRVSANVP
jgi:lipid A ethanolaminephosphotransferase